jgi:hypothetical protein
LYTVRYIPPRDGVTGFADHEGTETCRASSFDVRTGFADHEGDEDVPGVFI